MRVREERLDFSLVATSELGCSQISFKNSHGQRGIVCEILLMMNDIHNDSE